ncbi:hypothetical protein [Cupriavidus necator]|uniref:hypothetical protein n=1 Tax=Cupriavidus necator TaxID=106590 RepID=UPI003F7410F4
MILSPDGVVEFAQAVMNARLCALSCGRRKPVFRRRPALNFHQQHQRHQLRKMPLLCSLASRGRCASRQCGGDASMYCLHSDQALIDIQAEAKTSPRPEILFAQAFPN